MPAALFRRHANGRTAALATPHAYQRRGITGVAYDPLPPMKMPTTQLPSIRAMVKTAR